MRLVQGATLLAAVGLVNMPAAVHAGGGPAITGQELVQRIQAASLAAGSFHLKLWAQGEVSGQLRFKLHEELDFSRSPLTIRQHQSIRVVNLAKSLSTPVVLRTYTVVANGKASIQVGHRTPQCLPATNFLGLGRRILASSGLQISNPQVIGVEFLHGVSVWHLRATISLAVMGKRQEVVADIYAGAQDYRPIYETAMATLPFRGAALQEHIRVTYSRYGEPVNVSLPARCAK